MKTRLAIAALAAGFLVVVVGCSATSGAMTALRLGKNASEKDSYLKIMLDGHAAKQNTAQKAATGYSRFEVKDGVSTSPTLEFEIDEPDRFGRITMVTIQIHQKFEADYSHQAEFVVYSSDQSPEAQMKPKTPYALGAPEAPLQVINYRNEQVSGVQLEPGKKYMLVLTVKADKSETAQIYFETK
ncbi:MAG: hypothetical protein IPM18_11715 [Phycisphaerales bacterium]|nr:hypothetical protein [Phycisphaerales bacterium]